MIVNNLYQKIIENEFRNTDEIMILSGYASGNFLAKVLTSCPGIRIELHLGMSQEGIAESNHKIFKKITKENRNVNVYYQVEGSPNHMKIYSLFKNDKFYKSFVGSANFTENGFGYNREVIVQTSYSFFDVFEEQKLNSLICTHKDIEKYINIYFEETNYNTQDFIGNKEFTARQNRLIAARKRANHKYYEDFKIEIIKANDRNWESTGINGGLADQAPHLPIGTALFYKNVLPIDKELILETAWGEEFTFIASPSYRNGLFFPKIDIYEYLRKKVGVKKGDPLSRSDLEGKGFNNIIFVRLDEFKYYIEFY